MLIFKFSFMGFGISASISSSLVLLLSNSVTQFTLQGSTLYYLQDSFELTICKAQTRTLLAVDGSAF
jgi:hypothetical protein